MSVLKRPFSISLLASAGFILIWSTGWIMAKFAAQDSPPLTFLLWRYGGAGLGLIVLSLASKSIWPNTWQKWAHAATTGLLLHAGYLGAV